MKDRATNIVVAQPVDATDKLTLHCFVGEYAVPGAKHLNRYVTEFSGRHNDREADTIDQMVNIAEGMVGKRLRYQDLIA